MSGWDDDDFEPEVAVPAPRASTDKWEGEDSDEDNIKDEWDQESDEEKPSATATSASDDAAKATQRKKKKKLADILAAKEEAKMSEYEEQAKLKAEMDRLNSAEGKNAERMRLLKLEESANLQLAKEMLGVSSDGSIPETKEEFDQFEKAIADRVSSLSASEHYTRLLEGLIKRLCLEMNSASLKKVKATVESLHSAKLKEEKATKQSASKAKVSKSTVKMDLDKDFYSGAMDGGFDDMDDFM